MKRVLFKGISLLFLFMVFVFINSSKNFAQTQSSKTIAAKSKLKSRNVLAVDYTIFGNLPKLKQPTDNTCWATAATIMTSWKDKKNYSINELMGKAGKDFQDKFTADQGLGGDEKVFFLQALNLKAEAPQNYNVQGWLSLLKKYGPLWITTNEGSDEDFAIHARILKGLSGDGSNDATFFTFVDPADGQEHSESFSTFIKKFEDIAKEDSKSRDFRPQVVHY